jgi:hypothetical protein
MVRPSACVETTDANMVHKSSQGMVLARGRPYGEHFLTAHAYKFRMARVLISTLPFYKHTMAFALFVSKILVTIGGNLCEVGIEGKSIVTSKLSR